MSPDIEKLEDPSLTDLEDQHDLSIEAPPESIQPENQTRKSEFT